jgi:fatty-acyl-CoA synthase
MLLDADPGDADISSLKYAICGAAPLSVELFNRFERRTKMKIVEGYGLTEGTTASSINPLFGERKVGSIGIRLPYQQMRIVTDDPGGGLREAAEDEIGRIAIKGPNVFDGYLDPAHNTGIWIDDGWLDTGDLGRRDADGYFWLTGRKKELIIRGGHNIDPALIEEPLYRMNGVQMAAAVGRPEPHAGEVPVVYVQLQEGAALSGDQILDHLRDQIGERAAVPREVIVLEQLPLTAVGKLFKPALRWDAVRRALQAELETLTEVLSGFEIEVAEDKRRGLAAHVRASPAAGVDPAVMRDRVAERLSRYTVPWDLEVTQD